MAAIFSGAGFVWPAIATTAVAVGYWILAQVARRGDERALAIVVTVLTLQFLLSLAGLMAGYLRTGEFAGGAMLGLVVALLVLLALSRNYSDLSALRQTGLWSDVSPTNHPETRHCIAGGTLLACGLIGVYIALLVPAIGAARIARSRAEFTELVRLEEKSFLEEFATASHNASSNAVPELIAKLDALDGKVQTISNAAPSSSDLPSIIATYRDALSKWRSGLQLMQNGAGPATAASFEQGDVLRAKAFKDFDNQPISAIKPR